MLETLSADYVRTARAKGMPERRVLWRHVMRSAFLPVMSYLGPVAANVVTGSVIVEQIFSLPGIGRSEEHTSELQSLMRISYAVFCLKKKNKNPLIHMNQK